MPVVTAGVHFAPSSGAIWKVGRLLERQRVHIRAKSDRARTRSPGSANNANDACTTDGSLDLVAAEGGKTVRDIFGGELNVVEEFGVLMDMTAPSLSVGDQVLHGGGDRHRKDAPSKTPAG